MNSLQIDWSKQNILPAGAIFMDYDIYYRVVQRYTIDPCNFVPICIHRTNNTPHLAKEIFKGHYFYDYAAPII